MYLGSHTQFFSNKETGCETHLYEHNIMGAAKAGSGE
jgi:hypothetical protein